MSAIFGAILANLVPVIGSAVATLVGLGVHFMLGRLSKKIDSETLTKVLDQMDLLATQAVHSVEQTVVDKLVKSGEWGKGDSYKVALTAGVETLKQLAVAQLPSLTAAGVTDLNAYLTHLIEGKIKEIQLAKSASIVVPIPDIK